MSQIKQQNLIERELWLEEIEGEWFVCCAKRVGGKRRVLRRRVSEINEKIASVKTC